MTTALQPGIHPGIPFGEYLQLDAVNHSTLALFQRTPAHAHYAMTHPEEDTAALRTGDATHVAILEPARFERQYVKAPKFDRRTNKGKSDAAAWAADHPNQATLLPEEWDQAVAMRDAARAHPIAGALLSGKGRNELTGIWTDATTGLLCKLRIDRLTTYMDWSVVVDVKTARSAEPREFAKACAEYMYHEQAAFYLDGLNVIQPHRRRFLHLVVEKEAPYCVAVYELAEESIDEGRMQYRRALDTYARCMAEKRWPGYPLSVEPLDIPRWAFELNDPEHR